MTFEYEEICSIISQLESQTRVKHPDTQCWMELVLHKLRMIFLDHNITKEREYLQTVMKEGVEVD
jgi:hypothetical protein